MKIRNKKIGIGSISILLIVVAIIWSFTFKFNSVCIGDVILNTIGLKAWSSNNGTSGTHFTVYYSLIFLVVASILSFKYKDDFGAKVGKTISIIISILIIISIAFLI